jgi:hypothetical protein
MNQRKFGKPVQASASDSGSECGDFSGAMRKNGSNRLGLSATTAAVAGSISAPANGASACRLIETEVVTCEGFDFTRHRFVRRHTAGLVERLELPNSAFRFSPSD